MTKINNAMIILIIMLNLGFDQISKTIVRNDSLTAIQLVLSVIGLSF